MFVEQPRENTVGFGRLFGVEKDPSPLGQQVSGATPAACRRVASMLVADQALECTCRLLAAAGFGQQPGLGQCGLRCLVGFRKPFQNKGIGFEGGIGLLAGLECATLGQRDLRRDRVARGQVEHGGEGRGRVGRLAELPERPSQARQRSNSQCRLRRVVRFAPRRSRRLVR